jgi:hypothetical protein
MSELTVSSFFSQAPAQKLQHQPAKQPQAVAVQPPPSSNPAVQPPPIDDNEDMKLQVQIYAGKYQTKTDSIKLTFDNASPKTSSIRSSAQVGDDAACILVTFECRSDASLPELETLKKELQDFLDQIFEGNRNIPLVSPKVNLHIKDSQRVFYISAQFPPDVSAMSTGLIDAVLRIVDVQINLDRNNYAGHFFCNLQGSRNMLELAQEMAGFPPELAQLAQMYDSSETTLRFKTVTQLKDHDFLKDVPPEAQTYIKAVLKGEGLTPLLGLLMTALLKAMEEGSLDVDLVKSFLDTAFQNLGTLQGVQAVFGYACFDLNVNLPDFIPACQTQLQNLQPVPKPVVSRNNPPVVPANPPDVLNPLMVPQPGPLRDDGWESYDHLLY